MGDEGGGKGSVGWGMGECGVGDGGVWGGGWRNVGWGSVWGDGCVGCVCGGSGELTLAILSSSRAGDGSSLDHHTTYSVPKGGYTCHSFRESCREGGGHEVCHVTGHVTTALHAGLVL